ncbi:MAG TPA: polysaccharide deacetylase family protein [Anaerolineae bacterium]
MITVPILMYHSISLQASRQFKSFTLSPDLFASHITYLNENRYSPLTVSQLAAALDSNRLQPLPPRPVVITFDDGFEDFDRSVLPLLKRYHFAATLYVATGFVGKTSHWLLPEHEEKRPMLNWKQLNEIAAAGIECGAHTHTHPHLDNVSLEVARHEISTSKQVLEDRLGRAVATFAYPYGHYDKTVQHLVREAGFTSACAVKNALSHDGDDVFGLARIKISNNTDVPRFARLLNGNGLALASEREPLLTKGWRWYRRLRQSYS